MLLPEHLAERDLPSRDPDAIRQQVMDDLLSVTGATATAFYTITSPTTEGAALVFTRPAMAGDPDVRALWQAVDGLRLSELASQEEMLAAQTLVDRWEIQTPEGLPHRLVERFWKPVGIHTSVGVNLTSGQSFLGWCGALFAGADRPPPDVLARLTERLEPYRDLLATASHLERAVPDDTAVFVIRADRSIELASPSAGAWLEQDGFREALLNDVVTAEAEGQRRWSHGAWLQVHRVADADGGHGHVVVLRRPPVVAVQPVMKLSRRQREIAVLASRGATMKEMGEMLGIQAGTVHTHLKKIYELLGVGSRAELSMVVQEQGW